MNGKATEHAYSIRIRRNMRAWQVIGTVAGIKFLCLLLLPQLEQAREIPLVWAISAGMLGVSVRQLLHCRRLLQDSRLLRQEALTIQDERERAIQQKAQAYTLGYGVLLLFGAMPVSYFWNKTVFMTLAAAYFTILAIFLISKAFLRTRM